MTRFWLAPSNWPFPVYSTAHLMQHYSASAWLYLKYVKMHKHWIKKLIIEGKVENVISYLHSWLFALWGLDRAKSPSQQPMNELTKRLACRAGRRCLVHSHVSILAWLCSHQPPQRKAFRCPTQIATCHQPHYPVYRPPSAPAARCWTKTMILPQLYTTHLYSVGELCQHMQKNKKQKKTFHSWRVPHHAVLLKIWLTSRNIIEPILFLCFLDKKLNAL